MRAIWNKRTRLEKVLIIVLSLVLLAACASEVNAGMQPTGLGCEVQSTTNPYATDCPGTFYVVNLWWGNPDGSPGTNVYNGCVVWADAYKGGIWCPQPPLP